MGAGTPLPVGERAFFESRFGFDFGMVRVHANGVADDAARAIHAKAFTHGTHIAFAAGRYAPGTSSGRYLLAHELAHVVQQRSGRGPSGLSQAGDPFEREADQAALAVARGEPVILDRRGSGPEPATQSGAVQRSEDGTRDAPPEPPSGVTRPTPGQVSALRDLGLPNLREDNCAVLEWGDNGSYNCFAWTIGVNTQEIRESDINPQGTPSLADWDRFYASHGLGEAVRGKVEEATVVLFGTGELPEHGARRSIRTLNGQVAFESKLGRKHLVLHTLEALEGGTYGSVIRSYLPGTPQAAPRTGG